MLNQPKLLTTLKNAIFALQIQNNKLNKNERDPIEQNSKCKFRNQFQIT